MFKSEKIKIALAVFVFFGFCGWSGFCLAESGAERLTKVLPDNVIGFAATSGGAELKPAFEKTILGQMWYDTSTQSFYKAVKSEIIKKIKEEAGDPNEAMIPEAVLGFVKLALNRPIIGGVAEDKSNLRMPFYGFAILDGGDKKGQIDEALRKLEGLAGEGNVVGFNAGGLKMRSLKDTGEETLYWGWVGNYLVWALNDGKGEAVKYLRSPINRPQTDYLSKLEGNGDAVAMYFDFQKISLIIKSIAAIEGELQGIEKVTAVLNELGLSDVRAVKSRIGFAGADLVFDEIVELSPERKGLLESMKTVDTSMLDMVGSKVVNVTAFNADIGWIYDTVMRAIKIASPNDLYVEAQKGIRGIEEEIGFGIRGELLGSFAGPMVVYSVPAGALLEAPTGGIVLLAKMKDVNAFEKVIKKIGELATEKSDGMVQVSSQVQDGRTINTFAIMPLAMMQIMPTWTAVEDYIVIGMNVPLCNAAVRQMTDANRRANSIREVEDFKKATFGMPAGLVSLSYTDSKAQFNGLMMSAQQFWPMVTMFAAKGGVKLPFMLPSLSHISDKMGPSCGYSWFDKDGLRSRYKGVGIEQSFGTVAGVSMGMGILMPSLARVRHISQRVVSGTHLSGIGKALLLYANDNNGKYPPDLETLVKEADLSPKTLTCPRAPGDFPGKHYIYITGQNAFMDSSNIVIYENPEFCREGVNVLFNDGHVEFVEKEKFIEALKETYEQLGKPMPEIKFIN